jgi:hypothetical protein
MTTTVSDQIRSEREAAKLELTQRGIPFAEEQFLRHIRSGNREVVTIYLRAGISPDAVLDGESALAVSANHGHKEITKLLLDAGAEPLGIVEGLKAGKDRRNGWDKLSSLSGVFTFLSSLLVASVGWYFTNSYNERQLDLARTQARQEQETKAYQNHLAEMQTLEKMIPHLTKSESSKQVALIAISALASPELAARIGEIYGGEGSINALAQLAALDTEQSAAPAITALTNMAAREKGSDSRPAHDALARVLEGKERAIVKLLHNDNAICNGFVVDGRAGWIVTPGYCLTAGGGTKLKTAEFSIEVEDGSRIKVSNKKFSNNQLLAFLRVDTEELTDLQLSDKMTPTGGAITQIAFGLGRSSKLGSSHLNVILGRVLESGEMSFPNFERQGVNHKVRGLKVRLEVGQETLQGTAGGPLLDKEGNVTCITFTSDGKGNEQCVAAEVISDALQALQSG